MEERFVFSYLHLAGVGESPFFLQKHCTSEVLFLKDLFYRDFRETAMDF